MFTQKGLGGGGGGGGRGPRGRPGSPAPTSEIVFRPGAPSTGFYVATWAEVEARVLSADGNLSVLVDSSIAPAVVPAASDIDGHDFLTLGPARYTTADYSEATLDFEDGARIRNLKAIIGPLRITGVPTVRPMFDWDPTPSYHILLLRDGALIEMLPGATVSPMVASTAGLPFQVVFDYGSRYADNGLGLPCVALGAGTLMILIISECFDPSAFTPNLIGGDLSNTLIYIGDPTAPRPSPTFLWPSLPASVIFAMRSGMLENIAPSAGATVDRPSLTAMTGQMYFDSDLGLPVWWTGTQWVDATGAPA